MAGRGNELIMAVILILILASLAAALFFLGGFIWAVKSGQFDDTCTPALRVLADEERVSGTFSDKTANSKSKPT